jgi:hypothetical protein
MYTLRNEGSSPTHITSPTLWGFSQREGFFEKPFTGFSQREKPYRVGFVVHVCVGEKPLKNPYF